MRPFPTRPGGRLTVGLASLLLVLVGAACDGGDTAGTPTASATATPRAPLAAWQAALADRESEPAVWYSIGESLAEGQGASTPQTRWFGLLSERLRTAYPGGGSASYLPVQQRVYEPDSPWSSRYTSATGTLTMRDGSQNATFGFPDLGHKTMELADGATVTFTVTGTSVDLCWMVGPQSGALGYSVDGGPFVGEDGRQDEPVSRRTRVEFDTPGEHTVTVGASGTVNLSGLMVYDGGETSGITTVDGGWSSATVDLPFLQDLAAWRTTVADLSPDLVTIELGGNDVLQGTDLTTFRRQAEELVTTLQSLPSAPSIYWVFPYQSGADLANSDQFAAYQGQIEEMVAADPTLGLVALSDGMPATDASGQGLYSTDGLHPNDAGQQVLADLVAPVVLGPDATASPTPTASAAPTG